MKYQEKLLPYSCPKIRVNLSLMDDKSVLLTTIPNIMTLPFIPQAVLILPLLTVTVLNPVIPSVSPEHRQDGLPLC